MFYMHLLVNKRGPLAKIWLAAHWEKKLTKAHIFECNLEATVEKILSPKFTIALRTSGHLLLGVVRIYHRKAKYLMADCSEALTKMKTAFRPGLVDLPKQNFEATYQAITLPEEFHDFETPLPDVNAIDVAEHFTLNQSRPEDITLAEDYESNLFLCDRNLDGKPEALRKQSFFDGSILTSSNSLVVDCSMSVKGSALREETFCFEYDCFGDEEDAADMIEILLRDENTGLGQDILGMEEENPLSQEPLENSTAVESCCADTTNKEVSHLVSETTLVLKEDDGFVLEPLDAAAVTQRKKNRRKRKLFVDVDKELTCYAMYNQLNNCTDIMATLDLAPPTKKTMLWKKSGGVDKLLSHTTQLLLPAKLQMQGAVVLSESSSLVTSILGQEAETQQVELTNELTRNRKDSEEIRWNKRTLQFLKALQHLKRSGVSSFSFQDLSRKNNRKEAAAKFYILLVLKKQSIVELRQSVPFTDITATTGPMFDAH
ncbi:double-strand-break repair protein rad21-like protein 1 isoform X1 [Pezoporus flaviventris]|uniref:double-strand-break repair protein rad21-like protein 1 isoform X1 n=1 Tax=Pezoporus flaviventris TaxID=889875 RepID=UPI002AB2E2C2|nr:double-strand-break repair protein rad21-like protein 1 isoform X1 [Pezoporus flaviventris]XP_061297358.1 double-strand-break repair protein rad21-like protein 1 isoform X1 [Pezoporus flaviventris]